MLADPLHDRLRPVTDICCQLGEAPLWRDGINRLFWFDILGKRLYSYAPDKGDLTQRDMPFAASAPGIFDNDHLVLSTERGIEYFSIITGETLLTVKIECDNAKTRSNDGRVGPDGYFYVSTLGWYGEEGLGQYLFTLYIMTAVDNLPDTPLDDPFAGRLFALDAKVRGLMEPRFG